MTTDAARLKHEWSVIEDGFRAFWDARGLEGTWNRLRQQRLPPDIPPELLSYAQGMTMMVGMLQEDLRIHRLIRKMNPTRFNAHVRGAGQDARDLESDWKLYMASAWDHDLNPSRWLDDWVYEGQVAHGLTVPFVRWKQCPLGEDNQGRPISGTPIYIEKTVPESLGWPPGNYRNPSALWCKYTLSVIDCDIKNADGERPTYGSKDSKVLGWTSEPLPPDFYTVNANKQVEVIIRDAEDPIATCPLEGCDHPQRVITVYICPQGGTPDDYEQIEEYNSPFHVCSFRIVGGDIWHSERDPHRVFRPSAWILFDIALKYNLLLTELFVAHRREQADDTKVVNAGSADPVILAALATDKEGGATGEIERPKSGDRNFKVLPGPVQNVGTPSVELLKTMLAELKAQYATYRPNPALIGQMVISEVAATVGQIQAQGAGVPIGGDLANWDGEQAQIWQMLRHAIRYTGYYEPENKQTKYVAYVSGREKVKGYRGSAGAGDEVYLDAKKCERAVDFDIETSRDTPSEQRDRKLMALTGYEKGIYTTDDLLEAWDIFDVELQKELLFAQQTREIATPLIQRRIMMLLAARSSSKTGMDLGEEQLASQELAGFENQLKGPQTNHNTIAANQATMFPQPMELAPTGTPNGGSSGLAG